MTRHPQPESAGEAAACAPPDPAHPTRPAWEAAGARLARSASGTSWSLGDWILQGEAAFGATYALAAEVTGLAESTLRNTRTVCSRFDRSRRRESLTFGHHEAVAALPPADADALLARADSESLSVRRLRDLAAARKPVEAVDPRAGQLAAALRAALSLSKLSRQFLSEKARQELDHVVDELTRQATADALIGEEDVATDEDMRSGRYGRRV